jgi:hypothetical protein
MNPRDSAQNLAKIWQNSPAAQLKGVRQELPQAAATQTANV